ncbi:MAG: L-seryl-tRNA(Sec) selenium transferase [Verrucomicrobia bacterium]|nr:MAG: L-seryl-tRNA(Sec) selenium transferase [Verrucomicrobiota bacterium]
MNNQARSNKTAGSENQRRRDIPAVERVLQALGEVDLPRPAVLAIVRRELAALRSEKKVPDFDGVLARIRSSLHALRSARILPVINGTGVIVHTNLGRSPLGPTVVEALQSLAANYNNLEFDLTGGERGERSAYLEHNLALLCGAEAATVANNCAAALLLMLRHFTSDERKEVIISRGELIQIGGGFRIPEILEASGAKLREVGTTNKTALSDYSKAVGKQTAMILKVHRSNFFMGGFVESPSTEEIAALAKQKRLTFVEDLGSGAVVETEKITDIEHEPTPAEVLKRGVDMVCFSGDKLLGGPQAGIMAGKEKLVSALKREPFFRALRCDKLILSALETTVDLYLTGRAEETIPALTMLRASTEELQSRAEKIKVALEALPMKTVIGEGKSQIGGGTLPRSAIPSVTLDLQPLNISVTDFAARLRGGSPPVVGYVAAGRFKLDLRTVFPRQDEELFRAIHSAFATGTL